MPEITRFATIQELSSKATRVLKVTTKSGSQYTVGLVGFGAHRSVVVRGKGKDGSKIEIQDPMGALENGRSLFEVGPQEWVGQGIDVGSLSTSRIAKVEEVTDVSEVTSFAGLHRKPAATPEPRKVAGTPETPSAAPAPAANPPERTVERASVPVHVFAPPPAPAPKSSPASPPHAGPPRASAASPAVTPVASHARVVRRSRSHPLIVSEPPSGPLSLSAAPPPDPEPERTELETRVLDLEYAAAYLNRIHRSGRVLERLDRYPALMDRFEAAFSLCTLTVEALSKNILGEEEPRSPA